MREKEREERGVWESHERYIWQELAVGWGAGSGADAGVVTNKIKEAAKDSAHALEKSSGERDGKHSSQRRRAREKVLIRLASLSFGGNYPGHISHTT